MDKVNLENKRVLVTGGCGFLGERLINKLLDYKAKIYVIDIKDEFNSSVKVHYKKINLLNQNELKKFIEFSKPDIIFHLAAILNRT